MSNQMKDISITGIVSRIMGQYVIATDDGTEYKLSAIMLWEAIAPDFGSGDFALQIGNRMTATGTTDGYTIWRAVLFEV